MENPHEAAQSFQCQMCCASHQCQEEASPQSAGFSAPGCIQEYIQFRLCFRDNAHEAALFVGCVAKWKINV